MYNRFTKMTGQDGPPHSGTRLDMICFSAESSGHQAVAAFSAPYVATGLGPHNLVFHFCMFSFKVPCSVRGSTLCLGM
jgi:hypothetical protein